MQPRALWVLALVLIVAACGDRAGDQGSAEAELSAATPAATSGSEGASAATAAQPGYDLRFIDSMRAHHDQGIQMAQMAVEKATSAEVRQMAQKMIADQQQDEAQMRGWRDQWYPGQPDAHDMSMPGMSAMNMDMSKLQSATGHDFDHAFLEMMVPHHEGAIAMGRDGAAKAEHEELRRKAQEIADKQQREVEDIRKMQSSLEAH